MKKLLLFLSLMLFFQSCKMPMQEKPGSIELAQNINLYYNPIWDSLYDDDDEVLFNNTRIWLNDNIEYKPNFENYWEQPLTIYVRGYGDTNDYTILFMNIVYQVKGIEMELVEVDCGFTYLRYNNKLYSGINEYLIPKQVVNYKTFNEIFN